LRPTATTPGFFQERPTTCACTPLYGVRSLLAEVATSTAYRCQFSSPPSSCRYSTCLLSYDQKCWRMPRFESFVTAFAAEGSERGPTHTLSTPFTGAM
jgi:hypothetical protein